MSDKLQQAIQATRAGDKKNAQFLLTQAIQEEPDNPQSWYLLSLLVDDNEKKKTYLTKVLELDPDHAKAHQQILILTETAVSEEEPEAEPAVEILEEAATVVLSSGSPDLEAQDEGSTLPDWMAEDLPPAKEGAQEVAAETAVVAEAEPVPDWLEESVDEDWDQEEASPAEKSEQVEAQEPETVVDKSDEEKKEIVKKEPAKQGMNTQTYNFLLIGLVVVAVIVFFILAYMIYTTM